MSSGQRNSPSLALGVLALAYYAMCTAGIAMVGAVPAIAHGLGVDLPAIAHLIAVFSITFAIAAPAIQVLLGHLPRRNLLLGGLLTLLAGTALSALAPNAEVLLAARVLTGLGAAAIGPVASALGASLVPPAQQGRALATVFSGMTIASVLSVPLAVWVSTVLGWRWVYGSAALIALLAVLMVALLITERTPGQRLTRAQLTGVLRDPAIAAGVAVTTCALAGMFVIYTFIAPLLALRFHAAPSMVSSALLVFGIAGVAGNLVARRIADFWSADRAIAVSLVALIAAYALLGMAPASIPLALALLVLWAVAGDVYMPSQQRRLVEMAPQVRGLVLALNSSALYIGMSVGSSAAGAAYALRGVAALPGVAIVFLLAALAALWVSRLALRHKVRHPAARA